MFSSHVPVASISEQESLVEDGDKLQNMVDSTADFLAKVLQIRDDDVAVGVPLAEQIRKELIYYANMRRDGRLKYMHRLYDSYQFLCTADDLAVRMRNFAEENEGENIDLYEFGKEYPYFFADEIYEMNGNPRAYEVGGEGYQLMREAERMAREWVESLDHVLCNATGIRPTRGVDQSPELSVVKEKLALGISERLTLMAVGSVDEDNLSTHNLEALVSCEYQRMVMHSSEMKMSETNALAVFSDMLREPKSHSTRGALLYQREALRVLLENPPEELAEAMQEPDLAAMSAALDAEVDVEKRLADFERWATKHRDRFLCVGALSTGCKASWRASSERWFRQDVIMRNPKQPRDFQMPRPEFICCTPCYINSNARNKEMDELAARVDLLVRVVWDLASGGVLVPGIIAADCVAKAARSSIIRIRMAANVIRMERDTQRLGMALHSFVFNLYDMEGAHRKGIDEAACSLSRFSVRELETCFDTRCSILSLVCTPLTKCTYEKMVNKPDGRYLSFASDSLALLLPLIQQKRARLGVLPTHRPNAFLEMLGTVPKASRWEPVQGNLVLEVDDLRQGHGSLRGILDQMSEQGVLVVKSKPGKRRLRWELDTMQLWRMLTFYCSLNSLPNVRSRVVKLRPRQP